MHGNSTAPNPVSPASTGNAGAHFEARVGAYYLLTMVAGGEPRGLPGASITTVTLQQRMADHPLDDVVIHATNADGSPATLEIQAKRSLKFTASDKEFADVVEQIWLAYQKPEFSSSRYELAAAIARTTTRIEHDVQDVLHWARAHSDAETFHINIQRNGFASDGMRGFVEVFRDNLQKCGANTDDATVWTLLRRFQILIFDFEAVGSSYEYYAHERCRYALCPDQGERAGDFWAGLIVDAEMTGRAAGARSRQQIVEKFQIEGGYRFSTEPEHGTAFAKIAEEARFALLDVEEQIGGARLSRTTFVEEGNKKLVSGRLLNITGAPGSGKSMVLKRMAELCAEQGRVIVLRGGRIVGGGWLQFAHTIGTSSSPERFFTDLAAAGGATLFIDNIDQIDDIRERATISDLLNVAATLSGWRVVVTTTEESDEWTNNLPPIFRENIALLTVPEISDEEAMDLSEQNGAIADLLRPDHPARRIARNLFYLSRLVSAGSAKAKTISTETDLARLWWSYGGGRERDSGRFGRLKAMRQMGAEFMAHPGRPATKVDDLDSSVVAELLRLNAIREEVLGAEVAFRHDVFRDWTTGLMIADDPDRLKQLPKEKPVSVAIVRGLELAARLELDADSTGERWRQLLTHVTGPNVHGSWRRPILLALPRAEKSFERFEALKTVLLGDNGELLAEIVRLLLVVESQPVAEVANQVQPNLVAPPGASNFVYPKGPSWVSAIVWLSRHSRVLPPRIIPDVTQAFMAWLLVTSGLSIPVNREIVAVLFEWLALLDEAMRPRSFAPGEMLPKPLNIPHFKDAHELVRMTAFAFALVNTDAARRYMTNFNVADARYHEFAEIIKARGAMAKAAPAEFANFFLAGIIDPEEEKRSFDYRDHGPFGHHRYSFPTAGPSEGPMLELLQHSPADGLQLVRHIVEHATNWQRKRYQRSNNAFPHFTIVFPWGQQAFEGDAQVYQFARSSVPSPITASALMALEAWAHQKIELGEEPETVLRDILGPDGASSAFVAVALDIVLSHWPKFVELAWCFAATPQVLKLDNDRCTRDLAGIDDFNLTSDLNAGGTQSVQGLKARASRTTRLAETFPYYVLKRNGDIAPMLKAALENACSVIPEPEADEGVDPLNGLYATAQRALRMADPSNWETVKGTQEDGTEVDLIHYVPDEAEQKLFDAKTREVNDSIYQENMIAAIHLAFRDAARATPQLVSDAVKWAKVQLLQPTALENEDEFECKRLKRTVFMAAVLAVRNMTSGHKSEELEWATSLLKTGEDEPEGESYGNQHIEYCTKAIAAAGLVTLYGEAAHPELRSDLLKLATSQDPAVVNALATGFSKLKATDQLFLRSILRVLILTSSYVRNNVRDKKDRRITDRTEFIGSAIGAELDWLDQNGNEPTWPQIAPWQIRPRRRLRIPKQGAEPKTTPKSRQAPDLCANEARLGLISSHLIGLAVGDKLEWLVELTAHLANWAFDANGLDGDGQEGDNPPYSFNSNFFDYLGILVAALPHNVAMTKFIEPLLKLPEEACVDAMATLLRGFDRAIASTDAAKPKDFYALRKVLASWLQQTHFFRRAAEDKSFTCEIHLGDALCAMFYQESRRMGFRSTPRPPGDFEQILPTLTELVVRAPASGYIAILFLDLLEQSTNPNLLPCLLEALFAWCKTYDTDTNFWVRYDIGARASTWITKALTADAKVLSPQQLSDLRNVLDVLVRAGVTSACELEDFIDIMLSPDNY